MLTNKKRNKKIAEWIAVVIFLTISAVYFYGLHLSFWPDPEYGVHTLQFFYMDRFGGTFKLPQNNILSYIISYLSYQIFGVGFRGLRMVAAFKYFIVLAPCTLLSIYSVKEKKIKWHLLPLLAFLVVVINPGSSRYCGIFQSATTSFSYHQYPYDMHMEALFFALLECFLLEVLTHLKARKKQIVLTAVIVIIFIAGVKTTDLYFGIGFWIPMFFYFLTYLWKNNRKLFFGLILFIFGAIAALRVFSIIFVPLRQLFVVKHLGYGEWTTGNVIYGDSGFADFGNIWPSISNTVTSLLALFNVELSGVSIISVYTLTSVVRICLTLMIYVIAVRTIIHSIRCNGQKQDLLSVLCSYTILFTTLFVMFSSYGAQDRATRMLMIIIYYGVILLCRRAEQAVFPLLGDNVRSKWFAALFFSFCILISIRPVWKEDSHYEKYETDFPTLANIIKENELGIGMADIWRAAPLTEITEGECTVLIGTISDGELHPVLYSGGVHINYFITGINSGIDVESMYQLFGDPDEIYEYEEYTIYYYEEGMDI